MERRAEDLEVASKALFASDRGNKFEMPGHLETRIFAHVNSHTKSSSTMFWKIFGFANAAVALGLAMVVYFKSTQDIYTEVINHNFAVILDFSDIQASEIARAEIELPDGMKYFSTVYPEIAEQKTLSFDVDQQFKSEKVPVVVRSNETGKKTIKLRYFNAEGNLVAEKKFDVKVKSSKWSIL